MKIQCKLLGSLKYFGFITHDQRQLTRWIVLARYIQIWYFSWDYLIHWSTTLFLRRNCVFFSQSYVQFKFIRALWWCYCNIINHEFVICTIFFVHQCIKCDFMRVLLTNIFKYTELLSFQRFNGVLCSSFVPKTIKKLPEYYIRVLL